jgi:hypothetical protein
MIQSFPNVAGRLALQRISHKNCTAQHKQMSSPYATLHPTAFSPFAEYLLIKLLLPLLLLCNLASAQGTTAKIYDVTFSGTFQPAQGVVEAAIHVQQTRHLLRSLKLAAPPAKFSDFTGDGVIERQGQHLLWTVPKEGGSLFYKAKVNQQRGLVLDAKMTKNWAVLRLDDVFPAAAVLSVKQAKSRSTLELHGPAGWRFESRYGPVQEPRAVNDPGRRFDRPTGWLAAGELGIRKEYLGKRILTVAGPLNQDMRRLEIIAFLRWTMPKLLKIFPDFPRRLLIVGARDDMWRGGLSGPGSVFLHTERPLISENATSALLHEMVHIATGQATGQATGPRDDWIIEGLSEYYSLEILRRSGGLGAERFAQTLEWLEVWAKKENGRLTSPSSGANTARAVLVLDLIQNELEANDAGSLDQVVQQLLASGSVSSEKLQLLLESALGKPSKKLDKALQMYAKPN